MEKLEVVFEKDLWVKLRQVTDLEKGDKFHRVPTSCIGVWTQVFKPTNRGNAYVDNPSGRSCLSIKPIDVEAISYTDPR